MNLFADFENRIKTALETLDLVKEKRSELSFDRIVVEPPRDASHGDAATNAAMVLAKPLGVSPRVLADLIGEKLKEDADIAEVSVAGPGFLNIRLSVAYWQRLLANVIAGGTDFGRSQTGAGRKVNVEYVSANPTGPMHVGHCRGAVVGDALANLLAFAGYGVTKEYYINDAGSQIDVLARSVFLRYREALGEAVGEIPAGLYPGDYLIPVGEALAQEYGVRLHNMPEEQWMEIVKDRAIDAMMVMIREDLAALNVHHDLFYSERQLHANGAAAIRTAINDLTFKGHVYRGTLPPPKGQLPEDWEDREQTLFRSTEVGDDIDRPLIKSDGSYTYFAADVAYFKDKYDRGFDRMIYVLGADHGGYVKRLEAVAKAVSEGKAKLTVLLCQLVKLYRDGEPVKMSKRSGDFVTLRDVVEEVGRDSVRFMMLYRKSSEPLDFDFAKVTEQSKDNPVFYVQYAHARCMSIFRQAREAFGDIDLSPDVLEAAVTGITEPSEVQLIAKLAEYPRIIEASAQSMEPHRIAFYLYDLASSFHAHWNKGKDQPELRFVNDKNRQSSLARLGLVHAVASVLQSGLAITGTDAPQEMR
ncbi:MULTISPECIES: arginine--tRNA ligase [Rhizobium/Agrobacterium group]|uniref:Arginine--tRNA ligase n=2 Tax=Rhizobium/Agrobacterium group TaxID=227290 RepID=SYR_ALLAM|nr:MULTISPECIES: arginine--tRNA ligase [Rhizobium/Agrobacterium group]B9JXE6.1 RecName: Full=Arginine--tRNA ligase; AltName: Full=Arginyl-tRNA synthetase; Short=ArgRS [Allorhizobium ampelinum S4]ACM36924.1 arginyl-tRNA synthetase [Allorhizobium ampelinum S4]MCF1446411.1 arginine--tRNA ligase [Allorhizobium ampelinum]MCF1492707.1 arginine--tRNA ligase [Allorhizobium ampelinum]MUO31190.1 arginine--tRNA ligase [Agrobacterium vitis]MUO44799.1 arginine--tRNA ligase [Agrobacterium vitis]